MSVGVVPVDWMAIMKVHDRTISGVFNISIFAPSPADFPVVRNPGVDIIRFHRLKVRSHHMLTSYRPHDWTRCCKI